MDVKASFEKAYWELDPALPAEKKELAAATFRSVALNYIERKGSRPPKSHVRAVNELKRRDDIVITKPDKGSGVVVMDRTTPKLHRRHIQNLSLSAMRDRTQEADHLNTTILYYRKKNISSRLHAEFYQSRLLIKFARRDLDLLTCMVSLRLTNLSSQ